MLILNEQFPPADVRTSMVTYLLYILTTVFGDFEYHAYQNGVNAN